MSRDSSVTYIHLRQSRLADLFEEFCRPPSSHGTNASNARDPTNPNNSSNQQNGGSTNDGMIQIPGSFLPYEEIHLPAHLMPINPEDEDDVVPDMHAAFGIQQALGGNQGGNNGLNQGAQGAVREQERWRDLGMEELLNGVATNGGGAQGTAGGRLGNFESVMENLNGVGSTTRARREGRRTGLLLMR